MSVEELESVVTKLPPSELARFSEWFEEFMAEQWDRQIEQDVLSGRLSDAVNRADEHYKAGRHTPLLTQRTQRFSQRNESEEPFHSTLFPWLPLRPLR